MGVAGYFVSLRAGRNRPLEQHAFRDILHVRNLRRPGRLGRGDG
jgi:hypothetical protein